MKHIALLLAALLMFSLTGCDSSEAAGKASDSDKAGAYEVIPPEDARFHPRCGTSFLILVVIVSVFLYSVLPWGSIGLRVLFKLLLLPLVMGISYELLKWCGRSDNIATRIIRQPGIWVQHLTVFEPDDSMIEVAIAAVTPVLPEDPEDGKW